MGHRVNVMLDDEIWESLQQLPKGERSRLVNEALRDLLLRRQRRRAAKDMDTLRNSIPPIPGSTEGWVREDRDSHW